MVSTITASGIRSLSYCFVAAALRRGICMSGGEATAIGCGVTWTLSEPPHAASGHPGGEIGPDVVQVR
jgi:hypothetical protein